MDFDSPDNTPLVLDGNSLTFEKVVRAARNPFSRFAIAESAFEKIKQSRDWIDSLQKSGKPVVYGLNTGFGSLATVSISKENLKALQRNLIMSHSAGTGDPLPIDVVRAAMLLRANTLIKGYSGIRLTVIEKLLEMLEKGVTPWIPSQGSVGASGDLAPLSHLALVLSLGDSDDEHENSGKAYFFHRDIEEWELLPGWEAMKFAGISRVALEAKEGLALNNGTQISTALLLLALHDAGLLLKQADIAMAMSFEALNGITSAFHEKIHQLRPHPGQIKTAENIRRLIRNSRLTDIIPEKVQDAYSIRCHPQVMAGVRDTFSHICQVIGRELNATNDNPIILPELERENKAISGGNFHAQPIAFAADFLSIAICEIGSIAERRIFRMSDKNLNGGLPSFLTANRGLASGLMLAQYTAAALVSENKSLAHPASIDSIPTCENQEDHVSMAPIAARKARKIIRNVQKIVAIEMLYAAQALDLRMEISAGNGDRIKPGEVIGEGTFAAYRKFRGKIRFLSKDRPLYKDIEEAVQLVRSGEILNAVEDKIGELA